ncbi:augmenter of liver regeneration [Nannochloropsis oceanica]
MDIAANKSPKRKPSTCPTNTSKLTVECGVPLPLSTTLAEASFPMGTCGTRTTLDPRVFGPDAWQMLHLFAQNYPTDPQPQVVEACELMINALPYMLPSEVSGYAFGQFIIANIDNDGSFSPACQASTEYNMPCQAPDVACLNQNNLVNFFLRAHHSVDVKTKPCKALWSPQMAAEAYTYQTDFCATCIVWGTTPLCKAVGETDCSAVNTTQPCGAVAPYLGPTPAPVTSSPTSSPQLMVECGVTLQPSISDWPVGKCGNRTTGDPRVFGPYTWRTVHRFAQHYPVSPTPDVQEACVNFVNALPFLLPCPHCGYDLSEFIVANIENADTFSPACQGNTTFAMPCETIEDACSTRPSLISFFLRAHHNVDTHNKPCKPLWSREQASDAFAFQPNFCATGVVYGEYSLCRSESDVACVNFKTEPPCGAIVPPPTN